MGCVTYTYYMQLWGKLAGNFLYVFQWLIPYEKNMYNIITLPRNAHKICHHEIWYVKERWVINLRHMYHTSEFNGILVMIVA